MKKILLAAAFMGASALGAFAQTTTAPATDGDTPAVATPDTKNATAPVEGANSFTEEQAKERLSEAGYADITGLIAIDFMKPARIKVPEECTNVLRWHQAISSRPSAAA